LTDKIAEFYDYCASIYRDQADQPVRQWAETLTVSPDFKPVIFKGETEAAARARSSASCFRLSEQEEEEGEALSRWLDANIRFERDPRGQHVGVAVRPEEAHA
jgi:hypothetical protein